MTITYTPTQLRITYNLDHDQITLAEITRKPPTNARPLTEDTTAVYIVHTTDHNTKTTTTIDQPQEPDTHPAKAWQELHKTGYQAIDQHNTDALHCQLRLRTTPKRTQPTLQFHTPGKFHGLITILGSPHHTQPAIHFTITDLLGAHTHPPLLTKPTPGTTYTGTAGLIGYGTIKPENLILPPETKDNPTPHNPIITQGVIIRAYNPQTKINTDWHTTTHLTITLGQWTIQLCDPNKDIGIQQPPPNQGQK